jgi:CDP-2,3-bis-(O-geranylgeranyl)-sn-glycerol synthase
MIANAMPVLVSGSKPIDGGRLFFDKKPLLGKNKTWEGFMMGLIGAYLTASTIGVILDDIWIVAIATGAGIFALIGDIIGAFVKRRLNLPPGAPAPLLDQLDFFAATTLYYYLLGVQDVTARPLYVLITALIIVLLHIMTNWLAYLAGLKTSKF